MLISQGIWRRVLLWSSFECTVSGAPELKKRLVFENNDFDFIPLRYSGRERDVIFYFNSGKNERFAILTNCRF